MTTDNPGISAEIIVQRGRWFFAFVCATAFAIFLRLGYWQVVQGAELRLAADDQYSRSITRTGKRGEILTADGHTLVRNEEVYRLFAQPTELQIDPKTAAAQLAPLLAEQTASSASELTSVTDKIKYDLTTQLEKDKSWINLQYTVSAPVKAEIEKLKLRGVGFDPYDRRYYPEASMAAHALGFVGKTESGQEIGYFGLEGSLDKELKARTMTNTVLTDALGSLVQSDGTFSSTILDGRRVTTTIRRDIQYLAESQLAAGMQQYGASAGEVIIMEPKTGKILAMASYPNYNPSKFFQTSPELYKNPSISNLYEPGSTFKVLTVAAGIDSGVISPSTECPKCSGPRQFGQYTIRTWNDAYNPNITMETALAKSDNTAMMYVTDLLGAERFRSYVEKFGIGEPLGIELQEDTETPFPEKWGPVELATISFGQGISTNSLQMVRAIAAIANGGTLMRPMIVSSVEDTVSGELIENKPQPIRQVISAHTAFTVTRMMITAAQTGEAQWTSSRSHTIAGKTGTSQVANAGGYDEDKTVASFIGFAPPDDPKFIMLVKLTEPTTSPWAAETAAPLWYKLANKLFLLLQIQPDRAQSMTEQ